MAATGLFQISPYQWTPVAQLATENMKAASTTTANMDKERKQKKPSKGVLLAGLAGSLLGTAMDPLNLHGGSAISSSLGTMLAGGDGYDAMNGFQFGNYMGQNYSPGATVQKFGPLFSSMMGMI